MTPDEAQVALQIAQEHLNTALEAQGKADVAVKLAFSSWLDARDSAYPYTPPAYTVTPAYKSPIVITSRASRIDTTPEIDDILAQIKALQ